MLLTVYPKLQSRKHDVLLFDALELSVFAVTGTQKALQFGIDPLMPAVLGMLSGIGGGIQRDILSGEVPTILRAGLYAVAALAACGIVSLGQVLGRFGWVG